MSSKSEKKECLKCKKAFTLKTLKKNNGICGRCLKSENKMSNGKKLKIPKKLRVECWRRYNGDNLYGKCYACEQFLEFTSFHAGHVVSEYDGGMINIVNLRPICLSCNSSSGVMNLDEFKKSLTPLNQPVPMDVEPSDF